MTQTSLFDLEAVLPARAAAPKGFRYQSEIIGADEERTLVRNLRKLDFAPFQFHGFEGKRRVTSFGWRYDFNGGGLQRCADIPDFLLPLRERAAAFADLPAAALEHVLLTQYPAGASIGWHKDRPVFADVIGISLLSSCAFRFRRKAGSRWERCTVPVAARSVYLLRGAARAEWEHSIPAVDRERFSITFRTLKGT